MTNRQMIEGYHRSQEHHRQARHFTPGRQWAQYEIMGAASTPRDLLVVVHDDAPPSTSGFQRVDLIVNSGSATHSAQQSNGHLVNRYDEQNGVTDHTELYTDQQMAQISQVAGSAVIVPDRGGGGPPGAEAYSVRAPVLIGQRGEPVLNMRHLQPGSGADIDSLHHVQEGMDRARAAQSQSQVNFDDRYAPAGDDQLSATAWVEDVRGDQRSASPSVSPGDRFAQTSPPTSSAPGTGPGQPAARQERDRLPTSSQAGLAAMRGPTRSVPSVPAPGEPGSRFNPVVRERTPTRMVGTPVVDGVPVANSDQEQPLIIEVPKTTEQAKRKLRMPTVEEISAGGRIARQGAAGAAVGAKMSAAIPHPGGKVVGVVGGAVVGGAKGLVGEADQRVEAKRKAAEKDADSAEQGGATTPGRQTADSSPASGTTDTVSGWLPENLQKGTSERPGDERPVSETYGYQFEQGQTGQSGPEMGR